MSRNASTRKAVGIRLSDTHRQIIATLQSYYGRKWGISDVSQTDALEAGLTELRRMLDLEQGQRQDSQTKRSH